MEITAKTRMIRISPRKVRIVADLIREKNVNEASGLLTYMPQKGAFILKSSLTAP
jgi:large subunit ribosomal protein L22